MCVPVGSPFIIFLAICVLLSNSLTENSVASAVPLLVMVMLRVYLLFRYVVVGSGVFNVGIRSGAVVTVVSVVMSLLVSLCSLMVFRGSIIVCSVCSPVVPKVGVQSKFRVVVAPMVRLVMVCVPIRLLLSYSLTRMFCAAASPMLAIVVFMVYGSPV